jgi:hypothetical protein
MIALKSPRTILCANRPSNELESAS